MPQGGQGYLVEVRFWPLDEPAFPRGSFEVRTWSPALGQSWHEPGMTNRGHSLSGQLDWSRFD